MKHELSCKQVITGSGGLDFLKFASAQDASRNRDIVYGTYLHDIHERSMHHTLGLDVAFNKKLTDLCSMFMELTYVA
jgi:hypothetical protein